MARYTFSPHEGLTHQDYQSLAELRYQIRRFLRFSEQMARDVPLEPRQHQMMLAIKGLPEGVRPRVAELAERLQIEHHSAVELVNRLSAGGFVLRRPGKEDRREVLLALTAKGERVLRDLSMHHKNELRKLGPELIAALRRVLAAGKAGAASAGSARRNAALGIAEIKNNNKKPGRAVEHDGK